MGTPIRRTAIHNSWKTRRTNETMRLMLTTFVGIMFGLFLEVHLSPNIFPSIDRTYIENKYSSISTQALLNVWCSLRRISRKFNSAKMWVPTNPRGAERLPPGFVVPKSDLYTRRLWGLPNEDLIVKPRYLITFTVGYDQKKISMLQ